MRNRTSFSLLDAILIAALVALPVVALVARSRAAGTVRVVEVFRDNRLIGRYPLDRDRVINVGDDVKVEVRAGRARVAESDCPKGVCLRSGWQGATGRAIVCVPNRVTVSITGADPGYDAESY